MSRHHIADTADCLLFGYSNGWHILLVRRRWEPYAGRWAIPGGYIEKGESSELAARRELNEETNIACNTLCFVGHYDAPGRDPRGNVASDAWWGIVPALGGIGGCPTPEPADDAADARWWHIDRLPPTAFDHGAIVADAVAQLRGRHHQEMR